MSKLLKYKYKSYPEFLALRKKLQGQGDPNTFRIGGSDIGVVMGVDDYRSATVFFYEACEFVQKEDIKKMEMHRGKVQEPIMKDEYWKYVNPEDPTDEAYLENYYGKRKTFRKASRCNAIILNQKYPYLFVTPDYLIPKNQYHDRGVLEMKSPTWRASEKYEAGIATSYIAQCHMQMLVLDLNYGEIFAVEDATYIKMLQFNEVSDTIKKHMLDKSVDFHDRVLRGKKIVYDNTLSQLEKEQRLAMIAPEDDRPELYKEFLKEKHRPENAKAHIPGSAEQLQKVINYLMQKEGISDQTKDLLKLENEIRGWFMADIGYIEWEGVGAISYIDKFNVPKRILQKVA